MSKRGHVHGMGGVQHKRAFSLLLLYWSVFISGVQSLNRWRVQICTWYAVPRGCGRRFRTTGSDRG